MILHGDFETRNTVDLKKCGLGPYLESADLDVLCLGYAFDDWPADILTGDQLRDPEHLIADHVRKGGIFYAHNAQFELQVWNRVMHQRYGWPRLRLKQMRCTMAMSLAMGLPGDLNRATQAVGLSQSKDMEGHRLMLQMSKPRRMEHGKPIWWQDDTRLQRLYEYCRRDVEAERGLHHRLRELSPSERRYWFLDQKINTRGIPVDIPSIKKAIGLVTSEKTRLNSQLAVLTDFTVESANQHARLRAWLAQEGIQAESVGKPAMRALLASRLPDHVRRVLEIRQELARSSTAKLDAMLLGADKRNRVPYTVQYHGAFTGRAAGRRVQPLNMKRPEFKQNIIEFIAPRLDEKELLEVLCGPATEVISSCLRAMICAPAGKELIAGDYTAIEAIGLPWLAGDRDAVKEFQDHMDGAGEEPYCIMASEIFKKNVTKKDAKERQIGKVSVLQLGYGGGIGAFVTAAANYGIDLDELRKNVLPTASSEEVELATKSAKNYNARAKEPLPLEIGIAADVIKQRFRYKRNITTEYWQNLQWAAMEAVKNPGTAYFAGINATLFKKSGSFLWAKLPSGRLLCYPYPRTEMINPPWSTEEEKKKGTGKIEAITYMTVDSVTKQWVRTNTYGGKLSENITQAICADLLRFASFELEAAGYPIIFHVYDELVAEVREGFGSVDEFCALMSQVPDWCQDFPISATGWRGRRYRKE